VRRLALSRHALTDTSHPAVHTIYDLVQFNAKSWGDTPCFGTWKVIKIHKETTTTTIKMVNRVAKKRKLYQCCRRGRRKSSVAISRWPKKG
jgi:hypothetical protein